MRKNNILYKIMIKRYLKIVTELSNSPNYIINYNYKYNYNKIYYVRKYLFNYI